MTASRSGGIQSDGGAAVLRWHPNLLQSLQAAAGKQGWQGLWKGNGLNVLRAGPQKAIDFFSFELYKVLTRFSTYLAVHCWFAHSENVISNLSMHLGNLTGQPHMSFMRTTRFTNLLPSCSHVASLHNKLSVSPAAHGQTVKFFVPTKHGYYI